MAVFKMTNLKFLMKRKYRKSVTNNAFYKIFCRIKKINKRSLGVHTFAFLDMTDFVFQVVWTAVFSLNLLLPSYSVTGATESQSVVHVNVSAAL